MHGTIVLREAARKLYPWLPGQAHNHFIAPPAPVAKPQSRDIDLIDCVPFSLPPASTSPCSNAEFHPLHYLDGLARAVEKHGGRIFEGTKVMEANGTRAGVVTEGGARVHCDAVVLATNSPINLNLAIHSRQSPYKSYVVGLVIPRERYRLAEYWSTEEPYHYIRVEDWDEQNYLLIVGETGREGARLVQGLLVVPGIEGQLCTEVPPRCSWMH